MLYSTRTPTQPPLHPHERRRANIAIAIAAVAAIFSGVQAYESHQSRLNSQKALAAQTKTLEAQTRDAERSRIAAEKSADAASRSAEAALHGANDLADIATSGKLQLQNEQQRLQSEQQRLQSEQRVLSAENSPDIFQSDATVRQIQRGLRFEPGKTVRLSMGFYNDGKAVNRCTLRASAAVAKSSDAVDYSQLGTYPAVIDITPKGQIDFGMDITVNKDASFSDEKSFLYLYGSADCERTPYTDKPYHSKWCVAYPLSEDGTVVNLLHDCSK